MTNLANFGRCMWRNLESQDQSRVIQSEKYLKYCVSTTLKLCTQKKSLLQVRCNEKFTGNFIPLEEIPTLHCNSMKRPAYTAKYIGNEEFGGSFQNAVIFKSFRVNYQAYQI